jgi:endonuclease YncB( thermonuclease family)
MSRALACLALAGSLLCGPAVGQEIKGEARVLGADSLEVGGARFQLWGIDAPEMNQACFVDGVAWDCGPAAARKLLEIAALGPLACEPRTDPDRTRRAQRFAICRNGQGVDVALEMVKAGMAFALRAQTQDYAAAEDAARAAKLGIFRGVAVPPWEFRDAVRN